MVFVGSRHTQVIHLAIQSSLIGANQHNIFLGIGFLQLLKNINFYISNLIPFSAKVNLSFRQFVFAWTAFPHVIFLVFPLIINIYKVSPAVLSNNVFFSSGNLTLIHNVKERNVAVFPSHYSL